MRVGVEARAGWCQCHRQRSGGEGEGEGLKQRLGGAAAVAGVSQAGGEGGL